MEVIFDLADVKRFLLPFEIFSFDIFDTLIFRNIEGYEERSLKVCSLQCEYLQSIGIKLDPEVLNTYRDAEFEKTKVNGEEVNYTLAYSRILEYFGYVEDVQEIVNNLIDIETQFECQITYANPEAMKILPYLKNAGKKVVAISDMYLPKSSIISILNNSGLLSFFDEIIVSSESLLTKHTGQLFRFLVSKEIISATNTIHFGDNYFSDVTQPVQNGITAVWYNNEANERRKNEIIPKKEYNLSYIRHNRPFLEILSECCAVFLNSIYERAIKINAKTVYFLTRDADLLCPLFNEYWGDNPYAIKAQILHLDRKHSFFLNLKDLDALKSILWIFSENGDDNQVTLYDLANGTNSVEIINRYNPSILKLYGERKMKYLLEREMFSGLLRSIIEIKQAEVENYLAMESVFDEHNKIIVDIGYSGTFARELSNFVNQNNVRTGIIELEMLASNRFFKENAKQIRGNVRMMVPLVLPYELLNELVLVNSSWLEPFFLDRRMGALKGYTRGNNEPIRNFDDSISPAFIQLELDSLIRRKLEVVHSIDVKKLRKELASAVLYPDKNTIKLLDSFEHNKGFSNSRKESVFTQIQLHSLRRDLKKCIKGDFWLGGSLKKSKLGFLQFFLVKYINTLRKYY